MFEKNDPMYYVKSDYVHFMYCYELLKANFSDRTRDASKDDVLYFGVLITSWATYYRSLFDFFNPKSKIEENGQSSNNKKKSNGKHDDILIEDVLYKEPYNTFNNDNQRLLNKYEDKLSAYVCQPILNAKNKLEDIKLKINKLISHLTLNRISTFENGYYVWEVQNCSEYIMEAYNSFTKLYNSSKESMNDKSAFLTVDMETGKVITSYNRDNSNDSISKKKNFALWSAI